MPGASGGHSYFIRLRCGQFLSYSSSCDDSGLSTWADTGKTQEFRFVGTANADVEFAWTIEAVGRSTCSGRWLSFSTGCSDHAVNLGGSPATNGVFHLNAVSTTSPIQVPKAANSATACADPFVWHSAGASAFFLTCTGGEMGLLRSTSMGASIMFNEWGTDLGGKPPDWASSDSRWAPENLEFNVSLVEAFGAGVPGAGMNVLFFSDDQKADGRHRVGWAMSSKDGDAMAGSWKEYAAKALDLGGAKGGEIDQRARAPIRTGELRAGNCHSPPPPNPQPSPSTPGSTPVTPSTAAPHAGETVRLPTGRRSPVASADLFRDTDGTVYLLWKTDDNSVGAVTTRIFGQQISVDASKVSLIGSKQLLMDSSGLWWADSWVAGGSLIEGPELVKHGGYYYLFFAAGKYCQPDYAEGVARSKSIWGPYEKLPVPLLSTGMVGYSQNGEKLIGPGHASFVLDPATGHYYATYHASKGSDCNRCPPPHPRLSPRLPSSPPLAPPPTPTPAPPPTPPQSNQELIGASEVIRIRSEVTMEGNQTDEYIHR